MLGVKDVFRVAGGGIPPMVEWSQVMESNIVYTLIDEEHSTGCYAGDLQRSIVLLVRLVTYNRVMTEKGRQNIGL